jgi:hypothetical protein
MFAYARATAWQKGGILLYFVTIIANEFVFDVEHFYIEFLEGF